MKEPLIIPQTERNFYQNIFQNAREPDHDKQTQRKPDFTHSVPHMYLFIYLLIIVIWRIK